MDLLLVRVTVYDGWRNLYSFDGDVVNGTLEVNIFHQRNRFQSYLRIQVNMNRVPTLCFICLIILHCTYTGNENHVIVCPAHFYLLVLEMESSRQQKC